MAKKRSKIKIILVFLLLVFIALQFWQVDKNNNKDSLNGYPYFTKQSNINDTVLNILRTQCLDCHSNYTNYAWYSTIAPASFIIEHHIAEGKAELNFDSLNYIGFKQKQKVLTEMKKTITANEMPPKYYTLFHNLSRLSEYEKQVLFRWIEQETN